MPEATPIILALKNLLSALEGDCSIVFCEEDYKALTADKTIPCAYVYPESEPVLPEVNWPKFTLHCRVMRGSNKSKNEN